MNRPFCSTPSAQPGELGLSHSAKIRSTLAFGANRCAPAEDPAVTATSEAVVRQYERVQRIIWLPHSGLGDVRIADDLDGRQREAGGAAVRQSGGVDAGGEDRARLALEGNGPRGAAEAQLIVEAVSPFGKQFAAALLDHLGDNRGLVVGARLVVPGNAGLGVHRLDPLPRRR